MTTTIQHILTMANLKLKPSPFTPLPVAASRGGAWGENAPSWRLCPPHQKKKCPKWAIFGKFWIFAPSMPPTKKFLVPPLILPLFSLTIWENTWWNKNTFHLISGQHVLFQSQIYNNCTVVAFIFTWNQDLQKSETNITQVTVVLVYDKTRKLVLSG